MGLFKNRTVESVAVDLKKKFSKFYDIVKIGLYPAPSLRGLSDDILEDIEKLKNQIIKIKILEGIEKHGIIDKHLYDLGELFPQIIRDYEGPHRHIALSKLSRAENIINQLIEQFHYLENLL